MPAPNLSLNDIAVREHTKSIRCAELAEILRRLQTARGGIRRVLEDRAAQLRAKGAR